jgi:hypothetical protein
MNTFKVSGLIKLRVKSRRHAWVGAIVTRLPLYHTDLQSQRCMYAISLRSDGQAVMTGCGIDLCKPIKANSSLSVSQESVIDPVLVPKNAFVKLSLICFSNNCRSVVTSFNVYIYMYPSSATVEMFDAHVVQMPEVCFGGKQLKELSVNETHDLIARQISISCLILRV